MSLPTDAQERKQIPMYTGVLKYFPDALAAVAKLSLKGGEQHGQTAETLHWDRSKSGDELDALMRHILDGDWDAVAWRALANLQKQIENGYGRTEQREEAGTDEDDLPFKPLSYSKWKKQEGFILDGGDGRYFNVFESRVHSWSTDAMWGLYQKYLDSFEYGDVQPLERTEP